MAEEHVRGRMPTESNPGNRKPAIPPVFDTTGNEDYRRVTPENPLPTKDKDLDERLTAIENKLDSVIENGAINTQLSGSNVEKDVLINDEEPASIPSGGFVQTTLLLSKYTHIDVGFRKEDNARSDFDVELHLQLYHAPTVSVERIMQETDVYGALGRFEVIAPRAVIRFRNQSEDTVGLYRYVGGVLNG